MRLLQHIVCTVLLLLGLSAQAADEPALLSRVLPGKTLDQATEALKAAITSHNYTFVRDQAIDSRLVPQTWETKSVRVIYFCNFSKMNRALSIDVRAAQFLPCRITLFEKDGQVEMVAVNPAWASLALGNPLLHQDCLELKRDYLGIMEEAAL